MGRPTKYDPTHNIFVTKLCRLGATNEDLAVALEVDRSQVVRWSARNKDFRTAVKLGREESDAEVGERLFQRACGYEHDETRVYTDKQGVPHEVTTTKIYPPSEVACIFWLKNRRPDLWRDVNRQEHTGKDGGAIPFALVREALKANGEKPNG